MCISIPVYSTYISARDVKSAHTHTLLFHFGLRGKGRRNGGEGME